MAFASDRPPAGLGFGEQRDEFDVPADVAYFNTANLSPVLHRVRDAGVEALARRGRPWTIASDDWFSDVERLRALFARLVEADAEGVALVPATSYRDDYQPGARRFDMGHGPRSSSSRWRSLRSSRSSSGMFRGLRRR